jgi:SAM-dependent methyltransferase
VRNRLRLNGLIPRLLHNPGAMRTLRADLGDRWRVARSHLPFARTRLSLKHVRELRWWRGEVPKFPAWYRGELSELWGVPAPPDVAKVIGPDPFQNAVLTFISVRSDFYPEHLLVPPTHFAGRKVLDVGCGAVPFALAFVDCEVYGLDPLVNEYRALGFPLDQYSERMTYVKAGAEEIPFDDGSFDAVISVNAIDHVDDFARSAREICRVLRPGGVLRLEAHYHPPSKLEPHSLSDERLIAAFGHLGVRKVGERVAIEIERVSPGTFADAEETLTVWAND